MPDTARPRTGIRAPKGSTDTLDTYDNTVAAAFDLLDPLVALDGQGVLSARPTSTVSTPGKRGRLYFATDTGQMWRDYGTGWTEISTPAKRARVTYSLTGSTSQQAIPNGAATAVLFPEEVYDTDNMHAFAASPTDPANARLTCRTAGHYMVTAMVGWRLEATVPDAFYETAIVAVRVDAAAEKVARDGGGVASQETAALTVRHNLCALLDLGVGDYLYVEAQQSSGSTSHIDYDRFFAMTRLSA